MARSARSRAICAMNGCVIPAPAPCASTRQARAPRGRCINPETRVASLTGMVTGSGEAPTCCRGFMGRSLLRGSLRLTISSRVAGPRPALLKAASTSASAARSHLTRSCALALQLASAGSSSSGSIFSAGSCCCASPCISPATPSSSATPVCSCFSRLAQRCMVVFFSLSSSARIF
jgi:hypothetical protein